MDISWLWAGVDFSAMGGRTAEFLQRSAAAGCRLYRVTPCIGGVSAHCSVPCYRRLHPAAKRCHVRLRVLRRRGAWFYLAPMLRRRGLWAGLLLWGLLLLWCQGLVWSMDFGALSVGQRARAAQILREECGIEPGCRINDALLTAGEYALVNDRTEFSWASLNFEKGRLVVETVPAVAAPEIRAPAVVPLVAALSGTVLSVDVKEGTALVEPGQTVQKGQTLIDTTRTERDGTPVLRPAEGQVRAVFTVDGQTEQGLFYTGPLLTGQTSCQREWRCAGKSWYFPRRFETIQMEDAGSKTVSVRHTQASVWGLSLPISVTETTIRVQKKQTLAVLPSLALADARFLCKKKFFDQYPDAEILAAEETWEENADILRYSVKYTVAASIAVPRGEKG